MKRFLVVLTVALMAGTGLARAQKVDENSINRKIETIEAASKDPKRAEKPAVWIEMGDIYLDAGRVVIAPLFTNMDEISAVLNLGKAKEEPKTIDGQEYVLHIYPYVTLYFQNEVMKYWVVTKPVYTDALDKAAAAYLKAYSLDKSSHTVTKTKEGMQAVWDAYKKIADNDYNAKNYKQAAQYFVKAYDAAASEILQQTDSLSCYNAGLLSTVSNDFTTGEKYLKTCVDHGYLVGGDVYYLLSLCYLSEKKYSEAKDILSTALTKYPNNTKIIEGLTNVYAATGEDPTNILPYIDAAIAANPTNPELYVGKGRVFEKAGKYDEAIAAFKKSTELLPNDFSVNYNLGLTMMRKANKMAETLNSANITSPNAYNAELDKVYKAFEGALAPLEKAHTINPQDIATVELLKNNYFRLRDNSKAMMDNYNKYNELFKSMQQ